MFEEIKNILGEPYFECKYGLLYNMDCEKALEKLDSPCLASTITSPPYNIGKSYNPSYWTMQIVAILFGFR